MNEFELYKNSPNNFTIKLSKPNKALLMSLCNHIEVSQFQVTTTLAHSIQ